jgi:DNA excision repair protein ERCC-2
LPEVYQKLSTAPILSYNDVYNLINESEVRACPYFAQLYISADIYITTYNNGLPLPYNVQIIDEAHNLLRITTMPLHQVRQALSELDAPGSIEYLDDPKFLRDLLLPYLIDALEQDKKLIMAPRLLNLLGSARAAWVEDREVYFIHLSLPRSRAIYVSATLGPLSKVVNMPIIRIPTPTREAIVASWVSTKYDLFDLNMARRINDILFIMMKYYQKILLFATSRVKSLLRYNIDEEELAQGVQWDQGILALSPYGRKAEGVGLPADAVVVAGVPYLPPYARVEKVGLTREEIALATVLQNVGRATRSPDAKPTIILADERFLRMQGVADYFRLREVHDLPELDKTLKELKSQQQNQQTETDT